MNAREWIFIRDLMPDLGAVHSCAVFSTKTECDAAVRSARGTAKRAGMRLSFTTQRIEIVSRGVVIAAHVATARRAPATQAGKEQ